MKVIVIGDVLGSEQKNGKMDDGTKWDSHNLAVLEGLESNLVSVKNFVGTIPGRGEFVALECDARVSFGKLKVNALRRLDQVEALYTATPAAPTSK